MKIFSILVSTLLITSLCFGQRGKDGPKTISAPGALVNEYTFLSADAAAGSLNLTVDNSALNANGRFPASLSPGDLVLIIQMQGATIKGNVSDSTWGEILSY